MRKHFKIIKGQHEFSPCRQYRYLLWRQLEPKSLTIKPEDAFFLFIGLNPSTADEKTDDATLRRCKSFASRLGFHWLCMVNIFAFRATNPQDLLQQKLPVGIDNISWIIRAAKEADTIFAGWGVRGTFWNQNLVVTSYLRHLVKKPVYCWRITKDGHPEHPLYLPNDCGVWPFIYPP